jgi:hypothetical protein
MARRYIALTIGLAIAIVVIVGGFSLAALSGAFNAPAPVAGTYTFWTSSVTSMRARSPRSRWCPEQPVPP